MSPEPDAARRRGTASGTVLALGFTGASIALVLFLVFVSPFLRDQVLRDEGGLSERDVLAAGTFPGGAAWTVTAVLEDGVACVEAELDGQSPSRACAVDQQPTIGAVAVTRSPADPRWLMTGVLAPEVTALGVWLTDQTQAVVVPRRAGNGVPASFWFSFVEADAEVRALVASDRSEEVIAELVCEPVLATREGVADQADCHSGGQG